MDCGKEWGRVRMLVQAIGGESTYRKTELQNRRECNSISHTFLLLIVVISK